MYIVNFEIPAFLLSLFCLTYCLTAKRRQYKAPKTLKNKFASQHFVFLIMIISNILSSLSSIVGVYLNDATFNGATILQYLFHALYFIFHATLSVSFTCYIMNVTVTNINWKKITHFLFFIPYLVSEILILTNSFTNLCFFMDENLGYQRGPLMPLLYALGGFYVLMGFVFFLKNKKSISKVDSIAVGVFIIIAALGILIQAINSKLLVELFSEALACLVIMIVLEEKTGHIDITTGLLNRLAFTDTNRKLISSKQKYDLIIIRLVELEKIITSFGIREADSFLIEVSSFIGKEADVDDVYRYRRNDFAVIFKEKTKEEINEFLDNVIKRFSYEWKINSLNIKTDVIVLHVNVPNDVNSLDSLDNIFQSDFLKKKDGSYLVLPEEVEEITKQSSYELALRNAIKDNKLFLKFQPIWSCKKKYTTAIEALLRVDSDELGNVSPEVYIPIAEKTGLIKDIGLFVFEGVCKFLKDKRLNDTHIEYVELNLSVYQFMYSDLIDSFENIRKKYDIDPKLINLEITETAATVENKDVLDSLKRFKQLGYSLSLDDFGTGYSNLVRMVNTNFENIKLDKSILWNITKQNGEKESLNNLITFIKSLGSDIVQEGVETKDEFELAISSGCDYIQGYYFSEPIIADKLFEYLKKEKH